MKNSISDPQPATSNQQPTTDNQPPTTSRSTGPRTDAGKQRSSRNALTHGLTSRSALLPSEDQAAFDAHRRGFFDEYQPANSTETQLVQELVDTSWRLNRIPLLEAGLLSQNPAPQTLTPALATLGLHYTRLSRQFEKVVDKLREIQADRLEQQERNLRRAAGLLEFNKQKGIPYNPAQDGFVFSTGQVEAFTNHLKRLDKSRPIERNLGIMQSPVRVVSAAVGTAPTR